MKTDLSSYNNSWYNPGRSFLKRTIWFYVNAAFFKTSLIPSNSIKAFLLRLFGAKIGKSVQLKPCINIKYPWLLDIGDNTWIGENVWIDNLATVKIGSNACLSQGVMLLTGNHDYTKTTFNLIVKPITIENGAWVGAQSVVCPGVIMHSHSVLSANSIATKNLDAFGIYQGNPAVKIKDRVIA